MNLWNFLATRLHMVLPTLIPSLQRAFIQNGNNHDKILIAHEILFIFSEKKCY